MNTILNVSENQFEEGLFSRIEMSLRSLIHQAIHGKIEKVQKRHISNGIWEPLPGSVSAKMWKVFEEKKLNPLVSDFKKITLIALEHNWVYKSTYREFERWRVYNL